MNAAVKLVTIGKRLVSVDEISFVERFDPDANPDFKPEKDFKSRVVLLDRVMLLAEQPVREFAEAHGLHLFTQDEVAVSMVIAFKIETFEPTESFKPAKPYKTRLKWSDATGGEQSKLLVTEPETVIAELIEARVGTPVAGKRARRPRRGRKGSPRMEAFQS